jgi:7-carboxy-7-deazaguanine synthase
MYNVIEIFGPTIQGEGGHIGEIQHFVRLGGCDFRCAWCDTKYAWNPAGKDLTAKEIVRHVIDLGNSHCVHWITLSGGNPVIYNCSDLIDLAHRAGYKVNVETQGSIYAAWLASADAITLSPKPPSAGMPQDPKVLSAILGSFGRTSSVKIVIESGDDYDWAKRLRAQYLPKIPFVLQPCTHAGGDPLQTLKVLTSWVLASPTEAACWPNTRVLPQLHRLIWGDIRGV